MSMTVVKGLQSEIFVPITPKPVWAPVTKPLSEMTVALATAAGVHRKDQERFNLAGDFTWRKIPNDSEEDDLMVTHGGKELAAEGFIKACAPYHAGFMGGGGNIEKFTNETGPAVAQMLKEEGVDAVLLTAG